jgi:hypothetical protein
VLAPGCGPGGERGDRRPRLRDLAAGHRGVAAGARRRGRGLLVGIYVVCDFPACKPG